MEQSDLLKFAIQTLNQLNVSYAIVDSFASSIWGESRLTHDIDIIVDLKLSQAATLCAAFPDPEFYVSVAAVREAISRQSQFNVIHPTSGNKIDFMIVGNSGWAQAQLYRCKVVPLFADQNACIAAPEDVIFGKLIYYREGSSEKHLRDIAGMLKLSSPIIDREYVAKHAAPLGVTDIWQAILDRLEVK